mmetsp:Transcript_18964/g.47385  ORF Transcript_18964/g.47385 Transcript_18964/m.47385 type:complete len:206 (-) Transcript_18964:489-1106(-)
MSASESYTSCAFRPATKFTTLRFAKSTRTAQELSTTGNVRHTVSHHSGGTARNLSFFFGCAGSEIWHRSASAAPAKTRDQKSAAVSSPWKTTSAPPLSSAGGWMSITTWSGTGRPASSCCKNLRMRSRSRRTETMPEVRRRVPLLASSVVDRCSSVTTAPSAGTPAGPPAPPPRAGGWKRKSFWRMKSMKPDGDMPPEEPFFASL